MPRSRPIRPHFMKNRVPPSATESAGEARAGDPRASLAPAPGLLDRVLRIPLFWKIILANLALIVLVGVGVAVAAARSGGVVLHPLFVEGVVLGTLLLALGLNALLVWWALRPLQAIHGTLERVRRGESGARVPESLVADAHLQSLRVATNAMLDRLADERSRQAEASRQLLRSEARDRVRIAGELYDGTAQTVAGVLVRLRMVLRRCQEEADRESLEDLSDELREVLEALRFSARQLHPPELQDLGVRPALAAHARHLTADGGTVPVFQGDFDEQRLTAEGRTSLFRVVSEALTNAVRHARASSITVRFRHEPDGMVAVIQDDGVGFDVAQASISPSALGLHAIRERAAAALGSAEIESSPGWGTRVSVFLPWQTDGAAGRGEEIHHGGSGRLPDGHVVSAGGMIQVHQDS